MNRCPLTYAPCKEDYSPEGLKRFSRRLSGLHPLPFSGEELRLQAAARAEKMSIQGVQPKVSARLNIQLQKFDIVDNCGHYILKPQLADYQEVPENEDLTMKMAEAAGIDTPLHGLIYGRDRELCYCIRRFDRSGRNKKHHVEDFAQLGEHTRETKYRSSMEKVATIIETYCTFPAVDKLKLFRLTLFSFLVGNEDMHLKNFSIIRTEDIIRLSPAYDLLNTTIVLPSTTEELALPLHGKKSNLNRKDLIDYYALDRLQLSRRVVKKVMEQFEQVRNQWEKLLAESFLSDRMKQKFLDILNNRYTRIYN